MEIGRNDDVVHTKNKYLYQHGNRNELFVWIENKIDRWLKSYAIAATLKPHNEIERFSVFQCVRVFQNRSRCLFGWIRSWYLHISYQRNQTQHYLLKSLPLH